MRAWLLQVALFILLVASSWRTNHLFSRIIGEVNATGVGKRIPAFGVSYPWTALDILERHKTLCPLSPLRRRYAVWVAVAFALFIVNAFTFLTYAPKPGTR